MSIQGEVVLIKKTSEEEWVDLDLEVCTDDEGTASEDVEGRGSEGEEIRASEDETSTPSMSSSTSILLDSEEEQSFTGINRKRGAFKRFLSVGNKREVHNAAERERRDELLLLFKELKSVMGVDDEEERWSKVRILNEARLFIKELVIQEASLDLATEILLHDNFKLQRRLELMKKNYGSNSPAS